MPGSGGDPVAALVHDRTECRQQHRGAAEDEQVRRGGVVRVRGRIRQPVEVAEVRPVHAQQPRGGVHPGDERRDARAVGHGQGVRGVGAGREEQPVEKLAGGEFVPRPQARVAGVILAHVRGHGGRNGDRPVQVTRPDHQEGGHHLGDAGHRALGVQAATPQQLAGGRVLDRGRPCADPGRPGDHGHGHGSRGRGGGGQRDGRGQGCPGQQGGQATRRPHGTPVECSPDNRGKPVSCGTPSQSPRVNRGRRALMTRAARRDRDARP